MKTTVSTPTYVKFDDRLWFVAGIDEDDVQLKPLGYSTASHIWLNVNDPEWAEIVLSEDPAHIEVDMQVI